MKKTLDNLNTGQSGLIYEINTSNYIKKRLLNLGIIKNTKIKSLYKSPFKDPTTYLVRNSIIALRNKDAKNIIILTEDKNE